MKKNFTLFATTLILISQLISPAVVFAEETSSSTEQTAENSQTNKSEESSAVDNIVSTYEATSTDGITITPSYTEGATFSGSNVIYYTVGINGATISSGQSITFAFSDPSILSRFTPNGGTAYGSWTTDIDNGTVTYTFNVDVVPTANISFILNVQTKNLTTTGNTMTASLDDTVITTSTFNTTYVSPGGGGDYAGRMLFNGGGASTSSATTPDNFVSNFIYGTSFQYTANVATMDFNVIYDAGFYNNSKSDTTNRVVSIKFTSVDGSVNTTLSADDIYFSNKSGYPNTSTGYVTLESLGMTATQTSADTVTITLPDDKDFSWGYFYAFAGAPSVSAEYTVISTYTSDVYTTASSTTAAGYKFQSTGGTGFVPMINSSDRTVNTSEIIADVTAWLLNGVTATDVEDGDLSSKVTVQSDGGFAEAWAAKTPGVYTITYTVTDSDGNVVTTTSTATIYSDILVHYVDSAGETIKNDVTLSGNVGDTFTIDHADFTDSSKSYTYVSSTPDKLTGTYGETEQPSEVTVTYKWIEASDYVMAIGDITPTAADFKASAIDALGSDSAINVNLSNADLTTAGTYTVTLTSADGQTKDVTLTVVDENKQSITGSDYTMYVGGATPTVTDFKASATDINGNAIEVTVDLSQADTTKVGTYPVTLTASDGQTKVVNLIVRTRGSNGGGSGGNNGGDTVTKLPLYRLYNPNTGEHFYTLSSQERDIVAGYGWHDEGIAWNTPSAGNKVYRLYNPNSGDHLYTMDLTEYNYLATLGWNQEGVAFYSGTNESHPIYRAYNPNELKNNHLYTENMVEVNWIVSLGWKFEGIAFYAAD